MDWKTLIRDLVNSGMSQAAIAMNIGVTQPTISGIVKGSQKDVRWSIGERLRALHARQFPDNAEQKTAA
jgi:predicted transcriptional regulator